MKKKKLLIAVIIIVLVLAACFGAFVYLNKVFTNSTTRYSSFYQEPENTLDGVYLGSSAAYCFFMPTVAYEQEGICVYNLGTTVQPSCIQKNIIADVLETQSDMDVIVIELRNTVKMHNVDIDKYIRLVTDGMRRGSNRTDAIDTAIDYYKAIGTDFNTNRWSYYFPALRVIHAGSYHLTKDDWLLRGEEKTPYKGCTEFAGAKRVNVPEPVDYPGRDPINDATREYIEELLDYCKTLDQQVVFVSAPFNPKKGAEKKLGEINTICDMCEDSGFTVLNFNQEPLKSDLNMDWSGDYRDRAHTNAYGAARFSSYLASWLKENVPSLKDDHRGEAGYEDWDVQTQNLKDDLADLKGWNKAIRER